MSTATGCWIGRSPPAEQAVAEDLSPNGWRSITQTVLDGTFFCSTEFARRRLALGKGGAILNIGASYGWTGGPGASPSAAAKAGVMNLTASLAVEWAPDGIRVNCLIPGIFPHDDLPAAMRAPNPDEDPGARCPALRVGEPHELAFLASFLCSPFANYITGHNIPIDGGNWLRREMRMPLFRPVREWANTRAKRPTPAGKSSTKRQCILDEQTRFVCWCRSANHPIDPIRFG